MKKLISLFAALLVAVGTLAVSSCATSHDEDPIVDLSSFYLRGNMNTWANDSLDDGKMTANADGSYSIVYTAKAADDEFAIANSGWSVKYCNGTKVAPDGTDVSLESGGGNAKVTGQTPGNNYKMTVKPSSTSVSVKVELAGSNVPDFYILDTTTGMNKMDYDGTEYWRKRERSDKGIVEKIEKQITEMKEKEIKTIPYNQQKRQRKKKALSFEELHKILEDDE